MGVVHAVRQLADFTLDGEPRQTGDADGFTQEQTQHDALTDGLGEHLPDDARVERHARVRESEERHDDERRERGEFVHQVIEERRFASLVFRRRVASRGRTRVRRHGERRDDARDVGVDAAL